ncbi:MAG: dihydroorotase family protein [Candidatus Diapherotrites archaeon]|nr:dihydroorotase family protein [Candidatus Diapherotrites archaeon]
MNEWVLANGKTFIHGQITESHLGIRNGKISEISEKEIPGKKIIDCTGQIILPGAIDLHVHFRVPGAEHKETWETGSKAAVAGGVTTVFDMPNTAPLTTTNRILRQKMNLIKNNSYCNYGLYLGGTGTNLKEIRQTPANAIKLYLGSSTGNLLIQNRLKETFQAARKKNKLIALHAENEECIQKNKMHYLNPTLKDHNRIRSPECELQAVQDALELQQKTMARVHFAHVSLPESVKLIREAQEEGRTVSFECSPQHLFLNETHLKKLKNFGKVNPPLRSKSSQQKLLKLLYAQKIQCMASDHAPHTVAEKQLPYSQAPSGIPGVQTLLPLLLNEVAQKRIPLTYLAKSTSEIPARLMGLTKKGFIRKGFDADLTIMDLKTKSVIRNGDQFSKCAWTPFDGWKLKGKIHTTLVNGKIAFSNGKFLEKTGNG